MTNAGNLADVTTAGSSLKYKSIVLKGLNSRNIADNANPNIADTHRLFTNARIVVPLKCLSNFLGH